MKEIEDSGWCASTLTEWNRTCILNLFFQSRYSGRKLHGECDTKGHFYAPGKVRETLSRTSLPILFLLPRRLRPTFFPPAFSTSVSRPKTTTVKLFSYLECLQIYSSAIQTTNFSCLRYGGFPVTFGMRRVGRGLTSEGPTFFGCCWGQISGWQTPVSGMTDRKPGLL